MAKIQNNFLKGKMNKDLDERLVPKGEYREAQNILITDSEDSDVGAIENILGNALAKGTVPGIGVNLRASFKTIGYYNDTLNSKVYWFITDFNGFGSDIRTMRKARPSNTCKILMADLNSNSPVKVLVDGHFLNFSKNHLITGVNLIDDLLFWTDNYNQPRKINVTKALNAYNSGGNYYTMEEQVSVAKYAPYKAPTIKNPTNSENIKSDYLKEKFVRFSYRYKYEDGEYTTVAPFSQIVFEPLNSSVITNTVSEDFNVQDVYEKTVVDVMKNSINTFDLHIPLPSEENLISVDETGLVPGSGWVNDFRITNVEVLLKESDASSIKVVADIKVGTNTTFSSSFYSNINTEIVTPTAGLNFHRFFYKHTYSSEEPYKSLTEDQITRVYDQVPIRAKAQEITGNRVVYGNFTENYKLPKDQDGKNGVNYVIDSSIKKVSNTGENNTPGFNENLSDSYKFHSVKQRRTYQVGLVLADKFGRQSPVILTTNEDSSVSAKDTITINNVSLDLSNNGSSSAPLGNYSWDATHQLFGLSLNIEFKDDRIVEAQDVYNSDVNSSEYNPHGWYSWKIVVKQKQQEYYNVYTTHPIDSWSNKSDNLDSVSGSSWITLTGDNINKITKDLTELEAGATVTGSNSKVFPKVIKSTVENNTNYNSAASEGTVVNDSSTFGNAAQDPIEVITLGTSSEQGLVDDNDKPYGFLNTARDPLVAEIENFQTTNNLVLYSTTAEVFETATDSFKFIIGQGNDKNPFIQTGQYVESYANGLGSNLIEDEIVYDNIQFSGGGLTSIIEFNSHKPKMKIGLYVEGAFTQPTINGARVRSVIEKVTHAETSDHQTTIEISRPIQLPASNFLDIKEFTTVESIKEEFASSTPGVGNKFQEIELSKSQSIISSTHVIVFRNIDGSPVSVSRGLSVFETEPFESKLDIFYETSTSGLVSDLNFQMIDNIVGPTDFTFEESFENETGFIESMNATGDNLSGDEIGDFFANSVNIDPDMNFSIQEVTRGLNNLNVTEFFGVSNNKLVLQSPLMHEPPTFIDPDEGDESDDMQVNDFFVKAKAESEFDGGSTIQTFVVTLKNQAPTITNETFDSGYQGVIPINNAENNSIVAGGNIFNGSANNFLDHENLEISIVNLLGFQNDGTLEYGDAYGPAGQITWAPVQINGVTVYPKVFEVEQLNENSYQVKLINVNQVNTIEYLIDLLGGDDTSTMNLKLQVIDSGQEVAVIDLVFSFDDQTRIPVNTEQTCGVILGENAGEDTQFGLNTTTVYVSKGIANESPELTNQFFQNSLGGEQVEGVLLFVGNRVFVEPSIGEVLSQGSKVFWNGQSGPPFNTSDINLNANNIKFFECDEDGFINYIEACGYDEDTETGD